MAYWRSSIWNQDWTEFVRILKSSLFQKLFIEHIYIFVTVTLCLSFDLPSPFYFVTVSPEACPAFTVTSVLEGPCAGAGARKGGVGEGRSRSRRRRDMRVGGWKEKEQEAVRGWRRYTAVSEVWGVTGRECHNSLLCEEWRKWLDWSRTGLGLV